MRTLIFGFVLIAVASVGFYSLISASLAVLASRVRVSSNDGTQHRAQRYVVTYPPASLLKYGMTVMRDSGKMSRHPEPDIKAVAVSGVRPPGLPAAPPLP